MEKLMIVDGHNMLFRMFYGIPSPIKNKHGKDIRSVIGFVGSILKLTNLFSIDKLMVIFDSETSTLGRINEFSDYKKNRIDYSLVSDEKNPFTQLDDIYKALTFMEVNYVEVKEYEADDYISSICKHIKCRYNITIVSTDSDFYQLVDDQISIYNPRGKSGILYDKEKVFEKLGVYPNQIVDYKVLVGDSSDNISGVKSIGPKRAIEILKCGTIDEIINGDKATDKKYYDKIIKSKNIINRNKKLITMFSDIDVIFSEKNINYKFNAKSKVMDILSDCDVY